MIVSKRDFPGRGDLLVERHKRGSIPLSNLKMTRVAGTCKGIRLSHKEATPSLFGTRDGFHGGLPLWLRGKESTCQCRSHRRCGFNPWVGKITWRGHGNASILGWRITWTESLVGYSKCGGKESDTTKVT